MIKFIEIDARLIMVASKTIEINGQTITATGTIKVLETLEADDMPSAYILPQTPGEARQPQPHTIAR